MQFATQGQRLVIVGVTSPLGSFLDKPIGMSSAAGLIWLSPGGIQLGNGVSFTNIPELRLSTATGLRFAGGGLTATARAGTTATGGTRADTGASLALRGTTLDASGPAGGGTVLVGGALPVAPSLMMECARAWLPLWMPLVGSALLMHGLQRLLAAGRRSAPVVSSGSPQAPTPA
ncbi:MAG: hypothetical protein ACKOPS_00255, partial [Cyanobium sp.]